MENMKMAMFGLIKDKAIQDLRASHMEYGNFYVDKTLVFKKLADQIDNIVSNTPDVFSLERREWQPFFIYDTMMKGGSEHFFLLDNHKLPDKDGTSWSPTAFTTERFELWTANRGRASYPIAIPSNAPVAELDHDPLFQMNGKVHSARIKGKVYLIRSSVVKELDKARDNGIMFHRKKVSVEIPFRIQNGCQLQLLDSRMTDEDVFKGRVWMYVGEADYWKPLIDGGCYFSPCKLINPRPKKWLKEPFYFFNTQDHAIPISSR